MTDARGQSTNQEMRAQDLKRLDMMEQQKEQFQLAMMQKKEGRDLRIYQSMQNNQESQTLR